MPSRAAASTASSSPTPPASPWAISTRLARRLPSRMAQPRPSRTLARVLDVERRVTQLRHEVAGTTERLRVLRQLLREGITEDARQSLLQALGGDRWYE